MKITAERDNNSTIPGYLIFEGDLPDFVSFDRRLVCLEHFSKCELKS